MIEIKNANVVVNKNNELFNDLNLTFSSNKITGVIAPSGTGKTSIFNVMLGLLQVKKGEIIYDDKKLSSIKDYENITYMPQEEGLYLSLTGKANLLYFAKLKKIKLSNEEIKSLFDKYELTGKENVKLKNYSGGMKKKLGLMITLLGESKYIFLDEPTVGIDPVQKEVFWKTIRETLTEDKTIIVTTHVMEEADNCDELIFLRDKEVLVQDSKENILKKLNVDNLNEAFIKLTRGEL